MSADGTPAPDAPPIHPGVLTAGIDGTPLLLGGHCAACDRLHLPAGPACPYCGAATITTRPLSGTGRVWGSTTVTAAPPGYLGPVPFGFGVVELPDGLRVITRLAGPDPIAPGTAVTLTTEVLPVDPDGGAATTWTFAPDPTAPGGPRPDPPAPAGATPTAVGPSSAGAAGGYPVEVAGVGLHPFGRFADTSITDMGVTAVRAALAEAGITDRHGFQAAFCGTAYAGVAAGHKVLGALALTGGPIVDIEAGCASGAAALMLAAGAIRAGQYDTVLVFGIEKMPRGIIRSTFFEPWREQAGLAATPAYFALRAQRVLRESGLTAEDLARVVVKNRRNGVHNPDAMFRKEVSIEEVLASKPICDPLTLFMLCSPNEGAAAVVLRRATGPSTPRRITLASAVLRSHLPGNVLGEATPLSGLADDAAIPSPSTLAADAAYAEAGIGPDDVDIAECQDTDAARELLAYEELRFCAPGEAGRLLHGGATEPGGARPVNVSGGLLAKGEPLGASALGQVVELVRQLRGEAGDRQVADRRVGLAHTVGRGANASVTILTR